MKNHVSFNIKAKKKCDADGMILHCSNNKAREKSDNVLFPQYQKYNVISPDIHQKYKDVTERIEKIKGKKIQKNANHYLEGVLAFSEDQFRQDPSKFMREAPQLIEKYQKELSEKYGFEPLGFSLHFDEGNINKETGKKEMNIHAHLHFVNFDFNTNKARFREYQQKYISDRKVPNMHFVQMQDMAGEVFGKLGFNRGISKQLTNKKHLEKEDFIVEKLKKAEEKAELAEKRAEEAKNELEQTKAQIKGIRSRLKAFYGDLKEYIVRTINKEQKAAEKASVAVVEHIDFEPDEETKNQLKEAALRTDEELGSDRLRSKIKPK